MERDEKERPAARKARGSGRALSLTVLTKAKKASEDKRKIGEEEEALPALKKGVSHTHTALSVHFVVIG